MNTEPMIGDRRMEVMAKRERWARGISIYLREVIVGHSYSMAKKVIFEKIENEVEMSFCDPMVTLDETVSQQLMDELWQCGLRPSEGTGSAGSLAATQRHLEDMRTLVFKSESAR